MTVHAPNPRTPLYWAQDLWDRMRGQPQRPLGRWGWYRPPRGPGPLVWVYAPDCTGARVGAEVVRGIRSIRVDVRAVVTADWGCPETLRPLLQDYPGTATAPSVIDHQRAAQRAAARLGPNGLLAVHRLPPPRFLKGVAAAGVPLTAVSCEPPRVSPPGLDFDHILPVGQAQADRWRQAGYVPEDPVDLELFLARTDVEPNFKAALAPGEGRRLVWADAQPEDEAERNAFLVRWADEGHVPIIGGKGPGKGHGKPVVRLSEWDRDRQPVEPGTLVWMDEERWLPAVTASAFAGVLGDPSREAVWQALASGLPLVAIGRAPGRLRDLGVDPDTATRAADTWEEVSDNWARWEAEAFTWRDQQAATRRAYWEARRCAEVAMEVLDHWADGW
ncbi:hypothetical protein [Thiohalorhabdus sp.]|uniref:hypothetical protein n=1 Tax=Thiohalorhabdus sp. TaxID=3094134 RepID=UPI002FC289F6